MDYLSLKNHIIDIVNKSENSEKISELAKDNYYNVINSRRKIEKIQSVSDVFNLLEKRAELSKDNIKPFYYLLTKLPNDTGIIKLLDSYSQLNSGKSEKQNSHDNETTQSQLNLIHELISDEIGNNWRNLARNLKIPEGEIEIIDLKFGNDLKSKIWDILKYFKKSTDPTKHIEILCCVLEKCRRKDIKVKILKIISTD